MGNSIAEHWNSRDRRLPGINCIAYPDGSITILNCYSTYDPNTKTAQRICKPLCDTTIESIEKYGAAWWTVVDEWVSLDYRGGKLSGGDGTMGNEGYIARVDADGRLIWGMFFEDTNPIKSLEIQGHTLIAVNEHAELQITVNLDDLTEIGMSVLKTYDQA